MFLWYAYFHPHVDDAHSKFSDIKSLQFVETVGILFAGLGTFLHAFIEIFLKWPLPFSKKRS